MVKSLLTGRILFLLKIAVHQITLLKLYSVELGTGGG